MSRLFRRQTVTLAVITRDPQGELKGNFVQNMPPDHTDYLVVGWTNSNSHTFNNGRFRLTCLLSFQLSNSNHVIWEDRLSYSYITPYTEVHGTNFAAITLRHAIGWKQQGIKHVNQSFPYLLPLRNLGRDFRHSVHMCKWWSKYYAAFRYSPLIWGWHIFCLQCVVMSLQLWN